MGRKAKAKTRSAGGFSLPELMLTMLILVVVSGIAVDGIFTVRRIYRRTVDSANARTYLNTTMLALRSRLSLASEAEPNEDDTELTYTDPENGYCKVSNDAEKGIVVEYLNVSKESRKTPPDLYPVLTGAEGFLSAYDTIQYEYNPSTKTAFFTIKNLKVTKDNETLAEADSYIIHTVNPPID